MRENSKVRRYSRNFITVLLVLLVLAPFVHWQNQKAVYLNAVIMDKTVPNASFREHKGLMWILNNVKAFNQESSAPFSYATDYYGFVPGKDNTYDIRLLPQGLRGVDLLYLADCYGVYSADFYSDNQRGNRSSLIYGGMDEYDIKTIKNAVKENGVLVGEFNILETPTSEENREALENMFGVKWNGWIGRYFTDLASTNPELPVWLIDDYERQYSSKWSFKGPGMAFVAKDNRVIILEAGKDLGKNLNRIVFRDEALAEFKVRQDVRYYYWFDIVTPTAGSQVLANYQLDLSAEGKKKLGSFGLGDSFPAVVRTTSQQKTYYFAGDFADISSVPFTWRVSFLADAKKYVAVDLPGNEANFYWKVYYPLIKKIVLEVAHG